jgi:hypothetical protein
MSVDKIVVAGDWHGNAHWAKQVVRAARELDISRIVQLGDFGLWDHTDDGFEYLDELNAECRKQSVVVRFVDGNHENHDRLKWYDRHNPRTSVGHVYIRSHILHLPRGCSWQWGSRTFAAAGGAVSIDKAYRKEGRSWWAGEQLTDQEVGHKVPEGPIDYLFTHDCPTVAPFKNRIKMDYESQIHRQRMNEVGRKTQPKIWFHGHMHEKYEYLFEHRDGAAKVYGFEMDGDRYNWGVLMVNEGVFKWGPDYVWDLTNTL